MTTGAPDRTTILVTRPATAVTSAPPAVTETRTTGSVLIYSSPTGASILIDGVYQGTAPKNIDGVPAGSHILRLSLSGYYDYEGSIYIVPGQPAQGYGKLQPLNTITPAAITPLPTMLVPVIVPVVTATPGPAQDPGPLRNAAVIAALIGSVSVVIVAGAKIYTHVRPPKKE